MGLCCIAEPPSQRVDGVAGVLQDALAAGDERDRRRAAPVPRQQQEHQRRRQGRGTDTNTSTTLTYLLR